MLHLTIVKVATAALVASGLASGVTTSVSGDSVQTPQPRPALQAAPVLKSVQPASSAAEIAAGTCHPCNVHTENGNAPLFITGFIQESLPLNDSVTVTCYYKGNPPSGYLSDGFQDHVTRENWPFSHSGHIPDAYVNLGGRTPPEAGLPHCK